MDCPSCRYYKDFQIRKILPDIRCIGFAIRPLHRICNPMQVTIRISKSELFFPINVDGLQILIINGVRCKSDTTEALMPLYVGEFPSGLYLLRIVTARGTLFKRLTLLK